MRPTDRRRLVILAEGEFGPHTPRPPMGVIRYGRDDVVAVLDSTKAGQNVAAYLPGHDIPIVATLGRGARAAEAARRAADRHRADRRPAARAWRAIILAAIDAGPRRPLRAAHVPRRRPGVRGCGRGHAGTAIVDYRRPPERMETAVGRRHGPGKRVILTVGTDCAIGKMSVALELRRAAARGRRQRRRSCRPARPG